MGTRTTKSSGSTVFICKIDTFMGIEMPLSMDFAICEQSLGTLETPVAEKFFLLSVSFEDNALLE